MSVGSYIALLGIFLCSACTQPSQGGSSSKELEPWYVNTLRLESLCNKPEQSKDLRDPRCSFNGEDLDRLRQALVQMVGTAMPEQNRMAYRERKPSGQVSQWTYESIAVLANAGIDPPLFQRGQNVQAFTEGSMLTATQGQLHRAETRIQALATLLTEDAAYCRTIRPSAWLPLAPRSGQLCDFQGAPLEKVHASIKEMFEKPRPALESVVQEARNGLTYDTNSKNLTWYLRAMWRTMNWVSYPDAVMSPSGPSGLRYWLTQEQPRLVNTSTLTAEERLNYLRAFLTYYYCPTMNNLRR